MKKKGVTLIEVLIVIAIIALLMALLLPVLLSARKKAHETTCISNMRQLVAALLQYRQDHGDFPPFVQYVFPYTKNQEIFLCPYDFARELGGANWVGGSNRYASENRISLSYFYFADPVGNYRRQVELLPQVDPNHGVLACLLHGSCPSYCRNVSRPVIENCCQGLTLRARIDGSLQRVYTYMRPCNASDNLPTEIRDRWKFFTDAPCPPEICPKDCH